MTRMILLLFLFLSANVLAMDRWTALAMVESGCNDRTVGRAGEISRYQIRRELWPGGNPLDINIALANARRIMSAREAVFEQSHGRMPDDFEFYVLWNAPAQIDHPHRVVAERARRFVNLLGLERMERNGLIPPGGTFKDTPVSDCGSISSQPSRSSFALR